MNSTVRTSTWNNIGTAVSSGSKVADALETAGLNYTVAKENIVTESGLIIPNYVSTVKSTGEVAGVVSKNYEICQNADAFSFVDEISGARIVKAGETYTGMVYLIAEMDEVEVLGDSFKPYLIFQNSHNGRYTIKTAICPLRIVCQNQFAMAFKEASNTINIKHNGMLEYRLENAREVMLDTEKYLIELNRNSEKYAGIKLSKSQVDKVITEFFPIKDDMTDRQKNSVYKQRAEFIRAYNEEDNRNFRGNAWGMVNAYSDYLTHRDVKQTKNSADSQFMTVTLAPDFAKFISMINSVAVA